MSNNSANEPVRANRPSIVGPDAGPESPYPLRLEGPIIQGFGRGSRELGIPTANIPIDSDVVAGREEITSGIYYGWAGLSASADVHASAEAPHDEPAETLGLATASSELSSNSSNKSAPTHTVVYPMVMSVGWNPYYKNEKRSVEIHLLSHFHRDFYGAHIKLLILGFVRDELDYISRDALIQDIRTDIVVTRRSLARDSYRRWRDDGWLAA